MLQGRLTRRDFLRSTAMAGAGLVAVACVAPGAAPAAEEGAAPAGDVTTVRFMSRAGAENNVQAQKTLDEDFRSENPNIQVAVEAAPDGWVEKLLAQMVAGEAVDIFEAWGNIFFNWTERDLLLDVQPFVDRDMTDEQINDYNTFQWEGLVMLGKRVGMPKYINVMTVTVNVDLFEQYGVELPPEDGKWDHDDYANMAKQLTDAARAAGNEGQWGGWKPAWSWDRFWNTVYMFDGKIADEKYGTKCLMDSEESQAGLQWMYDRIWTDNTFARPGDIENKWGDDAITAGFVGFIEDGTYPIGRDKNMEDAGIKWNMYHVPTGPTGNPSFNLVNQSRVTVMEAYVSLSTEQEWGPDRLGNDTVPAGRNFAIRLPEGPCLHDVRFVYENGQSDERRGVNLCDVTNLVLPLQRQ